LIKIIFLIDTIQVQSFINPVKDLKIQNYF